MIRSVDVPASGGTVAPPSARARHLAELAVLLMMLSCGANVVAVKVLGPTRTMLFQFLVPAFAVVLAAVFLGETIVIAQILGGAVIVCGILVSRSRRFASPAV